MSGRYNFKSFFTYQSDNFNLGILIDTPSNQATFDFNTQGDSDFFWEKFAVLALPPDPSDLPESSTRSNDIVAGITMSLTNITTGRSLSNAPIPLANVDGYLQFQPVPMIWPKRSTLQVTLTNLSNFTGSGAFAIVSLSFHGTKAFF